MFAYLSKKLEMPQGAQVKCVSWSTNNNYLACGCENGMLKVLKIESSSDTNGQNNGAISKGLLAAPSNIAMNQTLEGHSAQIQVIAWNNVYSKLTTSDTKGLIIVWMLYKGAWYEEMVNNRNRSAVRGLAWSQDGEKICIVYEDGGVIVGSADGNRLWGKDIKGSVLTGVTWAPDVKSVLFVMNSGEVHLYDSTGAFTSKLEIEKWPKFQSPDDPDPIVCVKWKEISKKADDDLFSPSIAVIWRASRMTLMRNVNDENPTVIDTMLMTTCGDWSNNGQYIAIGGTPTTRNADYDQVNLFDSTGSFLQFVRAPGTPVSSVSWDYLSLRIAIGAGAHVYFANLRPAYKFAYFGSNVFAYVFSRSDGTNHISFWDTQKITTQEIAGRILEVKGDEEHFAVLSVSSNGVHAVSILNAVGAPVDGLTVVSMIPFTICLTESILVCVAENAVLLWRYHSAVSHSILVSDYHLKRRELMFHIDEKAGAKREAGEDPITSINEDFSKMPTRDKAVCADAAGSTLVIGRESGKLQIYAIPSGSLVYAIDSTVNMNIFPQRIILNCDASQLAMLDMSGHLSVCSLGSSLIHSSRIKKYDRKDVWNLIWARDNPNLLCLMEKTRMYVLRDDETEDPVITSGYLAYFKNLEVKIILMDEIMQDPENPKQEHVINVETKSLKETNGLLESETSLDEVTRYVEENSHPSLWRLLAKAALNRLNLSIAETAFVRCKDYGGIQFTKRVGNIPNELIRKAEVCSFFEDFNQAEKYYMEADRRDLASDMWKLLGEWKKLESASQTILRQKSSEKVYKEMNIAMGDKFFEEQNWDKALKCYQKADDPSKLADCYLMMEDYTSLNDLIPMIPERDVLLPKMAAAFEAVGLTNEAVAAYLACGLPEKAVEAAVMLSQWNLAMDLARKHILQSVGNVLLRYTGHLLETGEIIQAIELLRKSDKNFAAGKLLAMLALRQLNEDVQPNFVMAKKLLVMSGFMFSHRRSKGHLKEVQSAESPMKGTGLSAPKSRAIGEFEDTDISFNNYIPEEFCPTPEEYAWMREFPWRGAEAAHYMIKAQRLIYQGEYGNAMKIALRLRNYGDILGDERVHSMLALAAANSKSYNVCSRAFIQLEMIDEKYGEMASELFGEHMPKDVRTPKNPCPSCGTLIPEWGTSCSGCDSTFPVCILSGVAILDQTQAWICTVCKNSVNMRYINEFKFCPLCHQEKSLSSNRY